MAQKNERCTNECFGYRKKGNQNREAPQNVAAGKQTKRKYDETDYE